MARPKQKFCTNCNGENPKCKYLTTGRKCRVGKAKGKAVSQKTIDKREQNDSLLGDLHTDYLNFMRNRQIGTNIIEDTGEIVHYDSYKKPYSFERWLNINGHRTLATWLRRHYEDLERFNFYD